MGERNFGDGMDFDAEHALASFSDLDVHGSHYAGRSIGYFEPAVAQDFLSAKRAIRTPEFSAVITRVIREGDDSASFEFMPLGSHARSFRPQPGQFIRIRPTIDGVLRERCYAVSSLVAHGDVPRFTVRRVPKGLVSNWCHDALRSGVTIPMTPPEGSFRLRSGKGPLVFMGAGVALAPIFPMFKQALLYGRRPITLMTFHRSEQSAVFLKTIHALARRYTSRLRVAEFYAGDAGVVEQSKIEQRLGGLRDASIYMCGPDAFMQCAEAAALSAGVSPGRIFINAR